jgi:hypothetical protein
VVDLARQLVAPAGLHEIAPTCSERNGVFSTGAELTQNDQHYPARDARRLTDDSDNSKFWRVEDRAIVGESMPTNPSGNSYLVYRGLEAKDFTLKITRTASGVQVVALSSVSGTTSASRTIAQ